MQRRVAVLPAQPTLRCAFHPAPSTMSHSIDPGSYRSPDRQRSAVPLPIETESKAHDPYAAFRFGDYALFTAGNLLSITGRLMLAVAVEWEIYARTHSATALGLVGLAIAVPVVTLSLPAGHLADRFSRKHIILWSQVFSALMSLALALVSWKHLSIPQIAPLREGNRALTAVAAIFERHHPIFHFDDPSVPLIYLLLFFGASARTFSWAARSSFFPTLVPRDAFANAVTWNNSIFQIGSVVGPALSGFLVVYVGFSFVYLLDALCSFSFFFLVVLIRRSTQKRDKSDASTWKSLMAGLRFVFGRNVILATITLDLFAVLLGRRDGLDADFCGPNSSLRSGGSWLDACDAGHRRFYGGDAHCPFAANETCWQSVAVVRDWVRRRDDPVRLVESILVIARRAFSDRSVRQRERHHPRVDRATDDAG